MVNDMKLTRLLSGSLLFAVMFMCTASFAGTFTNDGILAAAPTDTVMVYSVNPPLVPAVKPNNDSVLAMAGGGDYNDNKETTCMTCNKVTDNILSKWRYGRTVMFAYSDMVTADKVNVLACGWIPAPVEKPMKIPITV